MTRIFELDGSTVEVNCCSECPFLDEGREEVVPWCRHPRSPGMVTIDVLEHDRVADGCPLRIKGSDTIRPTTNTLTYTWTCRGCHTLCQRSVPVCPRCGRDM